MCKKLFKQHVIKIIYVFQDIAKTTIKKTIAYIFINIYIFLTMNCKFRYILHIIIMIVIFTVFSFLKKTP